MDTINFEAVADAAATGLLCGITTNPSILSKTKNVPETLLQLLRLQSGPVAVQVTSNTAEEMVEDGMRIFEFSERMIVKIPVNHQGLIAMSRLRKEKVPVLGTGIFHSAQALLAANLGASYISPYFSRIGDAAFETLKTIAEIIRANRFHTKILAASLRELDHIIYCAQLGAAGVTIKEDLFYSLTAGPSSLDIFSQKFSSEWKETHGDASIKDLLSLAEKFSFNK